MCSSHTNEMMTIYQTEALEQKRVYLFRKKTRRLRKLKELTDRASLANFEQTLFSFDLQLQDHLRSSSFQTIPAEMVLRSREITLFGWNYHHLLQCLLRRRKMRILLIRGTLRQLPRHLI